MRRRDKATCPHYAGRLPLDTTDVVSRNLDSLSAAREHTPTVSCVGYIELRSPLLAPTLLHTSAYVGIRRHTSVYVGIRRHTSAYVGIRQHTFTKRRALHSSCLDSPVRFPAIPPLAAGVAVSLQPDMSAYVSIRQRTSACVSIRQLTSAYASMRQHTTAYVSLCQLTS